MPTARRSPSSASAQQDTRRHTSRRVRRPRTNHSARSPPGRERSRGCNTPATVHTHIRYIPVRREAERRHRLGSREPDAPRSAARVTHQPRTRVRRHLRRDRLFVLLHHVHRRAASHQARADERGRNAQQPAHPRPPAHSARIDRVARAGQLKGPQTMCDQDSRMRGKPPTSVACFADFGRSARDARRSSAHFTTSVACIATEVESACDRARRFRANQATLVASRTDCRVAASSISPAPRGRPALLVATLRWRSWRGALRSTPTLGRPAPAHKAPSRPIRHKTGPARAAPRSVYRPGAASAAPAATGLDLGGRTRSARSASRASSRHRAPCTRPSSTRTNTRSGASSPTRGPRSRARYDEHRLPPGHPRSLWIVPSSPRQKRWPPSSRTMSTTRRRHPSPPNRQPRRNKPSRARGSRSTARREAWSKPRRRLGELQVRVSRDATQCARTARRPQREHLAPRHAARCAHNSVRCETERAASGRPRRAACGCTNARLPADATEARGSRASPPPRSHAARTFVATPRSQAAFPLVLPPLPCALRQRSHPHATELARFRANRRPVSQRQRAAAGSTRPPRSSPLTPLWRRARARSPRGRLTERHLDAGNESSVVATAGSCLEATGAILREPSRTFYLPSTSRRISKV